MCVCVFACSCQCMVFLCARERERGRARARARGRERQRETHRGAYFINLINNAHILSNTGRKILQKNTHSHPSLNTGRGFLSLCPRGASLAPCALSDALACAGAPLASLRARLCMHINRLIPEMRRSSPSTHKWRRLAKGTPSSKLTVAKPNAGASLLN
jgi:hypothetical protein